MEIRKRKIVFENLTGGKIFRAYFYYYFSADSGYFNKKDISASVEGILELEFLSTRPIDNKTRERWQQEKLPLYGMRKMDRHKIKEAVSLTEEEFRKKEKEKTLQLQ